MYLQSPVTARDQDTGRIYVVCEFWHSREEQQVGTPSFLQNDFLMQIAPTYTRVKTQGGRLVRVDGVLVRPENVTEADNAIGWQYETLDKTNPELIAEVESNVLAYWQRAVRNGYSGDQRSFRSINEADPDGVLSKVLAWRGNHDYPGL